jgi:hypothetical protein
MKDPFLIQINISNPIHFVGSDKGHAHHGVTEPELSVKL